jgi:hypothetical protein
MERKDEIDEIFGGMKKKQKGIKIEGGNTGKEKRPTGKLWDEKETYDVRGKDIKTREYTEDGHPVYTLEELNIGRGRGTDECPFDCWCCY